MDEKELDKVFKEMEKDAKGDKKRKKKQAVGKLASSTEKKLDKLAKENKDADV